MPNILIKNLEQLRATNPLLGEALDSIASQMNNSNAQTGADPTSNQAAAPPPISQLNVSSGGGAFHVQIIDNNPITRQINYFLEYSETQGFQQPQVYPMGPSRNAYLNLGNKTLYMRAYSAYATGPASPAVFLGSTGNPQPVTGGGATTGAPLLPSAGSGTASSNGTQGGTGFGPTPVRTPSGLAPRVQGAGN